jgi:hypothetical protein
MSNTGSPETALPPGDKPQAEASTTLPEVVLDASRRRPKVLAAVVLSAALAAGTAPPPFVYSYSRRHDDLPAESSTREAEIDPCLLQSVRDLFEKGASEFFHDGMDSKFSRTLLNLLGSNGTAALAAIAEYLYQDEGNPEVVSEALRWLAEFGGPETLLKRWSILRHSLKSQSPAIRDGAILGFATLDDPSACSLLLEAENSEGLRELRSLIERVITRLERPR